MNWVESHRNYRALGAAFAILGLCGFLVYSDNCVEKLKEGDVVKCLYTNRDISIGEKLTGDMIEIREVEVDAEFRRCIGPFTAPKGNKFIKDVPEGTLLSHNHMVP